MDRTNTCNVKNDNKKTIEDLVRSDPPVSFWTYLWPLFDYVYTQKLKRDKGIDPGPLLLGFYGGLGALVALLPKNRSLLRGSLLTSGFLSLLGSAVLLGLGAKGMSKKRKPASTESQNILLERIRTGRARRREAYDVYYPPPSTPKTKKRVGMIFFPGALVNHTGYSEIAAGLSDRGILVVVLSLEPVRILLDLESNRQLARAAIVQIQQDNYNVDEWVLAGHSAGGNSALNIGVEIENFPFDPKFSNRLIVCGVGIKVYPGSLRKNYNHNHNNSNSNSTPNIPFQVLLVNGTDDGLLNTFVSEKERNTFVNDFLPPSEEEVIKEHGQRKNDMAWTRFVKIEGGNHCQFADYPFSPPDWEAKISPQEQKRIFVDAAAHFLLG